MTMPSSPFRPFAIISYLLFSIILIYFVVQETMMDEVVDVAPLSTALSQAEKKELQEFSEHLECIQIEDRDAVYDVFAKITTNDIITKEKQHILDVTERKNEAEKKPIRKQFRIGMIIFAISTVPTAIEIYMLRYS